MIKPKPPHYVCPICSCHPCICDTTPPPPPNCRFAGAKRSALALAALCAAWWVQIYSGNQWLHGGVYPTRERCLIARDNLITTYLAIGYKNVRGFCVNHGS